MNAARQKKLEAQLAATEAELVMLLRASLLHTATHGDMLFFHSRYRPDNVRPHWISSGSEAMLSLASDSSAIRNRLGLPPDGSPGQLYLAACAEAADTSNADRCGPRQLAAWLIEQLGAGWSTSNSTSMSDA